MKSYWLGVISGLGFAALAWTINPYAATLWHATALGQTVYEFEILVDKVCADKKLTSSEHFMSDTSEAMQSVQWQMRQLQESVVQLSSPWRTPIIERVEAADLRLTTQEAKLRGCWPEQYDQAPAESETP